MRHTKTLSRRLSQSQTVGSRNNHDYKVDQELENLTQTTFRNKNLKNQELWEKSRLSSRYSKK